MTNTLERYIRETVANLKREAVRATRIGIVGIAGLTANCSVVVKDDFNARLEVADVGTDNNQEASVVNPSDTSGLDVNSIDAATKDAVQPTIDTVTDAQTPDVLVDSPLVLDVSPDLNAMEDRQIADTATPTDLVTTTDTADVIDVPAFDGGATDLGTVDTGIDSGVDTGALVDATSTETAVDVGSDVIDASDTQDSGASDTTDGAIDANDSVVSDAPTDIGVDVGMTGPVINRPSGSAQPTCNRIIIEGIPGCMPGSATCEYNTRVGGAIRYYLETVTIPTGWAGPAIYYRFQSMLREPQISDFTAPDTARFTPIFTNGTYPTRVTMVLSPAVFSTCSGPTITIVNR